MSIFELQIKTSSFLASQLRAVQSRMICLPPAMVVDETSFQVQGIELRDNSIRHDVPTKFIVRPPQFREPYMEYEFPQVDGFLTQIVQEIHLHVTETSDILTHPNLPPAAVWPIPVTAFMMLSYDPTRAADCVLRTFFQSLEFGKLPTLPPGVDPDELKRTIIEFMSGALATPPVLFNFTELLASTITEMQNAGISVSSDRQRIAFRVEPRGGGTPIRWENFHRGFFPDRLHGADWAWFIEDGILGSYMNSMVENAMRTVSELRVSSVSSEYSNAGDSPYVDTTIHAFVDGDGTYVTPDVKTVVSVSKPNTVTMDIYLPDFKEVAESALPEVFGVLYFMAFELDIFAISLLVAWEALDISIPISGIGGPQCTKVTDTHFSCDQLMPIRSIAGADMSFREIVALEDGIALTGTMVVKRFTPSSLTSSFGEFYWRPITGSCRDASMSALEDVRENPAGHASLQAEILLGHNGTTPVYLCDARVFNRVQATTTFRRELLPTTIVVRVLDPKFRHVLADPKLAPVTVRDIPEILVATTAGIRLIRLSPPLQMNKASAMLIAEAIRVQLMLCDRIVGPWFRGERHFDLAWVDDPLLDPPRDLPLEHLWRVAILGMPEGQTVRLVSPGNEEEVMSAVARAGVPLRLAAVVSPAQGRELTVRLDVGRAPLPSTPAGEFERGAARRSQSEPVAAGVEGSVLQPSQSSESRGIEIQQQPVWITAAIPLLDICNCLIPSPLGGRLCVSAVLPDEIVTFDLSNPYRPVRIASWQQPGLRGACNWRQGLLAFGTDGFACIMSDAKMKPVGPDCEPIPIMAATSGQSVMYVLTDETLEVRSSRLCKISGSDFDGGRCMALLNRRLVVGGRNRLAVYDVSEERRPVLEGSRDDLDVTGLVVPAEAAADSVVAVLADGSARMLTISKGEIHDAATYRRTPWFGDSAFLGDLLVQIGPDRRFLKVARMGTPRLVVPAEHHP